MTKRDFLRMLIKLFGLYGATIAIFSLAPTYMGYYIGQDDWVILLLALGTLVIILVLLLAIVHGADKIIWALKLDKGYDDDRIDFGNVKEIQIVKLAVLVLGGMLIINNFPSFLNYCYLAFRAQITKGQLEGMLNQFIIERVDYFQFAFSALSMILGYVLITNCTKVSHWLVKADKQNKEE